MPLRLEVVGSDQLDYRNREILEATVPGWTDLDLRAVRLVRVVTVGGLSCTGDEASEVRTHLESGELTPVSDQTYGRLVDGAQVIARWIGRRGDWPIEVVDDVGFEVGGQDLPTTRLWLHVQFHVPEP